MHHSRPALFSDNERKTLRALARAAIPAGRFVRRACEDTIARLEQNLDAYSPGLLAAMRGVMRALDAAAYARHLRPFARLNPDQAEKLLETWRTGGYLRRSALRALLTPIKI